MCISLKIFQLNKKSKIPNLVKQRVRNPISKTDTQTWWIKVLARELGDPGLTWWKQRNNSHKLSPDPHMSHGTHMHLYTQSN